MRCSFCIISFLFEMLIFLFLLRFVSVDFFTTCSFKQAHRILKSDQTDENKKKKKRGRTSMINTFRQELFHTFQSNDSHAQEHVSSCDRSIAACEPRSDQFYEFIGFGDLDSCQVEKHQLESLSDIASKRFRRFFILAKECDEDRTDCSSCRAVVFLPFKRRHRP